MVPAVFAAVLHTAATAQWHARLRALGFLQTIMFRNFHVTPAANTAATEAAAGAASAGPEWTPAWREALPPFAAAPAAPPPTEAAARAARERTLALVLALQETPVMTYIVAAAEHVATAAAAAKKQRAPAPGSLHGHPLAAVADGRPEWLVPLLDHLDQCMLAVCRLRFGVGGPGDLTLPPLADAVAGKAFPTLSLDRVG